MVRLDGVDQFDHSLQNTFRTDFQYCRETKRDNLVDSQILVKHSNYSFVIIHLM